MITQEYLKECLSYCYETGVFTWCSDRPLVHFKNERYKRAWKSRFSGVTAGIVDTQGYIVISISGNSYTAHRLAWLYVYGSMPKNCIDHINRDKADNRMSNLRDVTHQENMRNRKQSKNSSSGHTGVHWDRRRKSWKVQIGTGNGQVCIGRYSKLEEAISARGCAEKRYSYHENHGKN